MYRLSIQLLAWATLACSLLGPLTTPGLARSAQSIDEAPVGTKGMARTPEETFIKVYAVGDLTGREAAARLRRIATDPAVADAARLKALQGLDAMEQSGDIEQASSEIVTLVRRMLNPGFDPEVQSVSIGDGGELLLSGNRMQHNSMRLLLQGMRKGDGRVELVVRVYELPPVPLPGWMLAADRDGSTKKNGGVTSWLHGRVREVGVDQPTYSRTVTGRVGRPISIGLTRRVPIVADYRTRRLVDSGEKLLEPVVEEVLEGPVIDVLVGRFGEQQLVVRAKLEHRSIARPIPTRTVRMGERADGTEVVVQDPRINVVKGATTIHTGFGDLVSLGTVHPWPTEPRTDYVVTIEVRQPE